MIRRKEECEVKIKEQMRGGPGQAVQTIFVNKEELLDHARLFGNLHLEPGNGIGYHVHENETEIFYLVDGEAIYNDNGTEMLVKTGDICICKSGEGHSITAKDRACDFVALIVLQ